MSSYTILLLAALFSVDVTSQFAAGPGFGETPQAMPLMTPSFQIARSNANATTASSGSLSSGKHASMDNSESSDSGSDSSVDGESGQSASRGRDDESGSSSASSSSSLEYECDCRMLRRVSLMGASDYCLAPNALLSSKCGNIELGEHGACPMTGAQPCSLQGHVLANDSLCALDDKDETYKCVASKDDLEIQKHGGKKKKRSNRRNRSSASKSFAMSQQRLAYRWLPLAVCVVAGVMAIV